MTRDAAQEFCSELASCGAVLEDVVRGAVQSGCPDDEVGEIQNLLAPLLTSIFLDLARPVLGRYPDLDQLFTGKPNGT